MSSVVEAIADGARAESAVWAAALRAEPSWQPVLLAARSARRIALGLETVYEAYLMHYGPPRLFEPPDADEAVLLGDYLYAHGLVRDRRGGRRRGGRRAGRADLALRGAARGRAARRRRGLGRRRARARRRRRTTTRSRDALALPLR